MGNNNYIYKLDKNNSDKLVMMWGDSYYNYILDKKGTGYLVMQYYPDSINFSRDAEYTATQLGSYGMGEIQSWGGTSGLKMGDITTYFSRDYEDDNYLWLNEYDYDVEMLISLMYSLMIPKYESDRIVTPPQVWFDWGINNIAGMGNNMHEVSRFYITGLSHEILSIFPETKKIRAVKFDIALAETVFIDGKVRTTAAANMYHNQLNTYKARMAIGSNKKIINYNFG